MQMFHLDNFVKGWLVGDFDPAVMKTDQFEVAVKKYLKGDSEKKHYHKIAKEITVAVSGMFELNGRVIREGDMVVLEPGEAAEFRCIEDGYNVVIKTPSAKSDKYLVS